MIGPEAGRPCLHRFTTDEQSGIRLGQCLACRFVLFGFPIGMTCFHDGVPPRPDHQARSGLCPRVSGDRSAREPCASSTMSMFDGIRTFR
ncbi:hypothetical protein SXCC_00310 [Gluconacetobacter sp. SXCC-1]|nr:hypothetical protein SXCC_00310 [Gluconacetobacter sp. SXCC-1]